MLFGDLHCAFTLHLVKTLLGWLDETARRFSTRVRHRPIDIHPGAVQAAQIAERLALRRGERSFWRFVFALSEFQGQLPVRLSELEQALKTRTLLMNESLATSRAAARLERDRLIALGYEIHATPTLFINGLRIEGEISRPHMEQLVNEEKEQVEALLMNPYPERKPTRSEWTQTCSIGNANSYNRTSTCIWPAKAFQPAAACLAPICRCRPARPTRLLLPRESVIAWRRGTGAAR